MWYEIFKFELKYRAKRADTYVFFLVLFLFSMVGVDFIFQGMEFTTVKKNAPLVIAKTMGAITGIFMILASMIMGVAVLRDFEYNIESLMYVNPIKKKEYLLGRFLGSFTVLFFVFTGILFGMILGEFMPWHNPNDLNPFSVSVYLKPFIIITLPILLFGACLFFVTGALSRKLVVVYTQGVVFFVAFMLTKAIKNEYLQAIMDPFSLTTLTLLTDSWSIVDRNVFNIPFSGVLLYNKLFWMLLGAVILWFGYRKFSFNLIRNKRLKKKSLVTTITEENSNYATKIPQFTFQKELQTKWTQFLHLSWFYFVNICKQPSFWAIMICGMIIILINSVSLGTIYGVDSYPKTYFIVEELQETSSYFFIILLVFYSGEIIWKERGANVNLIYDATPISNFISLLSKYVGLLLIYMVLIATLIFTGIIFQTLNGYYDYELEVYFYGFFLEVLPFLALYTCIAIFAQVVTNRKFVGILAVLLFFMFNIALAVMGYDHDLYWFGGSSLGKYSDMNGYGHLLKPYLYIKTYWFLVGFLLLILGAILSVRGTENSLKKRWSSGKYSMSKRLKTFTIVVFCSFLGLGTYIFYNTNVLNKYWTNTEEIAFKASYEKELKKFEYIKQPKITSVNLQVELYPEKQNYTAKGSYILKNTSETPIDKIHVQKKIEDYVSLKNVIFEGGARVDKRYQKYDYSIYQLNKTLQPGDSIKMSFVQEYTSQGFEMKSSNQSIVHNGTFFNNNSFPTLGYNRKYELRNTNDRAEFDLPKRLNKARREDANELENARSGSDSDGIQLEIVIGTNKNQTAVAPGNLVKQWKSNNRNYFHYKTAIPIINFYSIVSAEYELAKDTWVAPKTKNLVELEVYYHKGHEYNVQRMMDAMKKSFDYYSTHFSPYQYNHMRITEFPRYAQFAQSFPGTVPFSEAMGFVLNIDDGKDVDMAFFITAHELAHQWFGMQVEAANVQGQHFILETLSQYAALMVLKKHFSKEKVAQFLELQQTDYKEGLRKESKQEPSLALVENQSYVYYAKGAINMYKLQEAIGEDRVNRALKAFIADWHSQHGKLKTATKRYATSKDLLTYLKNVTPESKQELINELFK
ncbi:MULTISPECIES: ABC transporter permease/M1 family aminopeptidase [unclassified Tenacibaculum]|uniref:ABC transporter permease/M1 family aminopeptidase n=1 Tax=unclassified Tenacibaculum TaxID=2635139 RepID=UPI001F212272|nr:MULTISPECIES: M1 family aminopeptidase [unclassified Tenacibaculum]MCF2875795.1 peptidase M1 [Tenacibaculum sp. Cn5-1]MCF2935870.1 peptidase M1 [Tenacibaculum sp. Cn5-34]MCG7512431.1 peptidase M1 [Tenacibaculum sp. Cn5-46]